MHGIFFKADLMGSSAFVFMVQPARPWSFLMPISYRVASNR
jgi:hypothetical protein